jgi:hypothetical protein
MSKGLSGCLSALVVAMLFGAAVLPAQAADEFRVRPYLQNPTSKEVTVRWLSESNQAGTVVIDGKTYTSTPVQAVALDYQAAEPAADRYASLPYLHTVRVEGLQANTAYDYQVTNGTDSLGGSFRTPLTSATASGLTAGQGVRLFVYGDSETEPESIGKKAEWTPSLASGSTRPNWVNGQYIATQTEGYAQNLAIIQSRVADAQSKGLATLVSVVGDLVESGGEQRDWDEFWRHNAGERGSLASNVAIIPAFGNHENYGGPGELGGYNAAAAQAAADKFQTYFEVADNGQANVEVAPGTYADHTGRYHRTNFGPVTLITVDSSNGGTNGTANDTNFYLDNAANPQIPDYAPGSAQYEWLESQLAAAQADGQIVFVQYHHAAYSAGIHGQEPGTGTGQDNQSGQPMRELTPLLAQYDVKAVFSGHDEMYEHAIVDGIHFFDIGIGGDGLRGTTFGSPDYMQEFLAQTDALEVWDGNVLLSGGKHYGHLEIDAIFNADGQWDVTLTPAYAFPILSSTDPGQIIGWERRAYDDSVTFTTVPEPGTGLLVLSGIAAGLIVRRYRRRGN